MAIPLLFGTEFQASFAQVGDQDQSALVALNNGRFGVFYTSDLTGSNADIRLRIFHADGTPVASNSDFSVDPRPSNQDQASAAILKNGRILVAFRDADTTGNSDTSGTHVDRLTRNLDGSPDSASVRTNVFTPGNQLAPVVAGLDSGRSVVVWQDDGGATRNIRMRIIDSTGLTNSIFDLPVATNTAGGQVEPSIAALPTAKFVVTWTDGSGTGGDSSVNSIKAKIFQSGSSQAAAVIKDEFLVNTGVTANAQTNSVVTPFLDGFIVAWQHDVQAGAGGDSDIRARIFNGSGTAQGVELLLAGGSRTQSAPAITALKDGRFVAAWVEFAFSTNLGTSIRAAVFNADGTTDGAFTVNTTDTGNQTDPSIAVLADGRFVISWTDDSQTGSDPFGTAIRAQIFDPRSTGVSIVGRSDTDDELIGTAFTDSMIGSGGNDLLDGRGGNDGLNGGEGDDTYILGADADTITDTGGIDTITSTISRNLASFAAVENLVLLGAGNLSGTGNALANTITGNAGDNVLDGAAGTDVLQGGAGNDRYVLGAGTDTVVDTAGFDTITSTVSRSLAGFATIERLILEGGNLNGTGNALANTLVGTDGDNALNGGAGIDTLDGGLGNDTYTIEADADLVADTGGFDTLSSTVTRSLVDFPAIERLILVGAADVNGTGNGLNNTLIGNAGRNNLAGGDGVDTLTGGLGRDVLSGGLGNDLFDFNAVAETGTNANTRDAITDFVKGQDRIDLGTIDANGADAGATAFIFIATGAFTSIAGQLRFLQLDNANNALDQTIIEADIDGNAAADFQIQLTGLINLAAADFVL